MTHPPPTQSTHPLTTGAPECALPLPLQTQARWPCRNPAITRTRILPAGRPAAGAPERALPPPLQNHLPLPPPTRRLQAHPSVPHLQPSHYLQ
ncbi:hypothetical protein B0H10DRAFT_2216964 [Mycena sp. CBHHK59/15]|nr:hypothetical protein B0H10DRAFT_2216964 [Mycena sp. CBHHK59/15]